MAGDNFDLQGWMREQRQGPYTGAKGVEKVALKSSKPKSKTGLNEGLMGMIDLQPVGHLSEEFNDDDFEAGMNDEEDLDNYFNSYPEDNELGKDEYDIPTNDQDYMTQPGYVHEDDDMDDEDAPEIEDTFNAPSEFDMEDDDSMMGGADTSFDKIQAGLINVQSKMDSLLAGFKSGAVSKDMYVAKRKMLQSMRDKLEAQLTMSDDEYDDDL